jgi:phosphatidate phosphatase PAH1
MRPGADLVVGRYAAQGYQPVYLTARPAVLDLVSRRWLAEHGFPAGPVHTTVSLGEALPTNGGVGTYKRDQLRAWEHSPGLVFVAAYGNATTDIFAYAQAGISPSVTYIVGDHGGEAAAGYAPTQAVTDFVSHLHDLASLPPAP